MIYNRTGHVEVQDDMAEELLRAADQYMLDGLKQLCEQALERKLRVDTLFSIVETSEKFNAQQLTRNCTLFALAHHAELIKASPHSSCDGRDGTVVHA